MRAALVPMKSFGEAKMRLAGALDERERRELAQAMFVDVVGALSESHCFDVVAVISDDSEVFWHARELGARPIAEPGTLTGLNESLTFGQRYLARRVGADELLIVPADTPLLRADDVRTVMAALGGSDGGGRCVIVRARDNGTNALALRPPEAVAMAYGRDSADAHRAAAVAAGLDVVELDLPRVAFDVDADEDVHALAGLDAGPATLAWVQARAQAGAPQAKG